MKETNIKPIVEEGYLFLRMADIIDKLSTAKHWSFTSSQGGSSRRIPTMLKDILTEGEITELQEKLAYEVISIVAKKKELKFESLKKLVEEK